MAKLNGIRNGEEYVFEEFVLEPGTAPFETAPNTANPDNPEFNLDIFISHKRGRSLGAITANMETVCHTTEDVIRYAQQGVLPTVHQFQPIEQRLAIAHDLAEVTLDTELYPYAAIQPDGRILYSMAVGYGKAIPHTKQLIEAGVPIIRLDTANGYTPGFFRTIKELRQWQDNTIGIVSETRELTEKYEAELDTGNVATATGVERLAQAGADVVICGIGPGTGCGTAGFIGVHKGQMTALAECSQAAVENNVGLIADGGVRSPRTYGYALAWADRGVMMGSIFAATDGSPAKRQQGENGEEVWYYGSASTYARMERARKYPDIFRYDDTDPREGFEGWIPARGSLEEVMGPLNRTLMEQMYYVGAMDLKTFKEYAVFNHLSPAAAKEVNKEFINGHSKS